MKKEYGKEYETDEERIAFLEDNADSVENKEYFKRFTPQELKEKKDRKIDVDVEVADLDEEKKAKMKEYKDKIDPLAKEGKQLLKCIKKKGQVVSGRLSSLSITKNEWLVSTTNKVILWNPARLSRMNFKQQSFK